MEYFLEKVDETKKDILYRLLQFSLYDGSQYIDNELNDDCLYDYKWFNNYFTDDNRDAFFIKDDNNYIGFVMVNENLKFNKSGKCIAEFLVIPRYRRCHIGKRVAYDIFNMYDGLWEVQPMENNPAAYAFWKNIINEYTNGNYEIKNDGVEDVFLFRKM
jgi:predicted acetyltransferase